MYHALVDVEYDQSDPRYVKLRMTQGIENQRINASVYVNNASQLFPSLMPPFMSELFSKILGMDEESLFHERIHGQTRKISFSFRKMSLNMLFWILQKCLSTVDLQWSSYSGHPRQYGFRMTLLRE